MPEFTTEQILAMAPDSSSAKAGQGLVSPGKWVTLGCSETAVWGDCQGSGSKPYEVSIDLSEPAFRCSCPSRKFPCKHGLGLLLIYANNRAAIKDTTPPASVSEWLGKRGEKAEKKAVAAETPKTDAEIAKAAAEQEKRANLREKKVKQGLQDLRLWLCDLVRHGISDLPSRPYKFWDEPAGRLVDAQVPGVARMLRDLASIPASGEGWQERLVERIGLLMLLLEAYSRLDTLPEPVQADVRETIGWNVRQETVLAGDGIQDFWSVLGQRSYEEDQFRVTRTWLHARDTRRDALNIQFTRQGQPMETLLAPGMAFEAEMAFFPGAWPMRALIKQRKASSSLSGPFPGAQEFSALLDRYSDALAHNPWIPVVPAALGSVVPVNSGGVWRLQDATGRTLPIGREFDQGWKMLAIGGGNPMDIFAEWDGAHLLPLSVWSQNRLISLS